eukprot:CAMPEP_0171634528 /NCGR_PEP_ID=MMETSP0990-20121206/25986_1 /TAXON_ID=483369 /ORGANISM="non described non described, Strain CCMP2098" /LENGTH=102 /DNA_ID=CAMNT_0012205721 /DNA_START=165 /DNA_END=471 /DNA_ORIENTATION=+
MALHHQTGAFANLWATFSGLWRADTLLKRHISSLEPTLILQTEPLQDNSSTPPLHSNRAIQAPMALLHQPGAFANLWATFSGLWRADTLLKRHISSLEPTLT